jgi:ATP phosphoribosyltransferase regulatory subunit
LPVLPDVVKALDSLDYLLSALPEVPVSVDLGDLRGYQYHSGVMFAIYDTTAANALVRGGRYDDVGLAFGRARPATGFSLDLRELMRLGRSKVQSSAIRAPWSRDTGLRHAIDRQRELGEIVVQAMPHHEHEPEEYAYDRELVLTTDGWKVVGIDGQGAAN